MSLDSRCEYHKKIKILEYVIESALSELDYYIITEHGIDERVMKAFHILQNYKEKKK
jgi:hypothetical protein